MISVLVFFGGEGGWFGFRVSDFEGKGLEFGLSTNLQTTFFHGPS